MLVVALANMRQRDPVPILMQLLDDPDLAAFAAIALGKRRAAPAARELRALTDHPDSRLRAEARKALRRIERSAGSLRLE